MITVIKQNPLGAEMLRYQGEVIERSPRRIIIQAAWSNPPKDLGYTRFERGDSFTEYYYTDRWFNIFAIIGSDQQRKGWYCNIAQPAVFFADRIEQVDLFLDVWVNPQGQPLILDEDEFAAATTLSDEQRTGARAGLQTLLALLASRSEAFSPLGS